MVVVLGGCAKESASSAAPTAGESAPAPAPSDGMAMYAGQLYGCLHQVTGEHIAQSSGHPEFDAALLAAAARCREVPPPPPDVLALLQQQGLTLLFKR